MDFERVPFEIGSQKPNLNPSKALSRFERHEKKPFLGEKTGQRNTNHRKEKNGQENNYSGRSVQCPCKKEGFKFVSIYSDGQRDISSKNEEIN